MLWLKHQNSCRRSLLKAIALCVWKGIQATCILAHSNMISGECCKSTVLTCTSPEMQQMVQMEGTQMVFMHCKCVMQSSHVTFGHFWLSAPYTTIVLTGALAPNRDWEAYTILVQVQALSTSPIWGTDFHDWFSFATCHSASSSWAWVCLWPIVLQMRRSLNDCMKMGKTITKHLATTTDHHIIMQLICVRN